MVEKKFLKAIKDFDLISENDRILVAFSGGIDSTVLTELLLKLKKTLKISEIALAHLNHSLRGKESDKDEEFCKKFAQERNLHIYTKKVDVKELAKKNKLSVEEAARIVRYSFFEEIIKEKNYNKLATGHHLSDLVETMLLWFVQGNRKGIKGFKPRENNIIRPMYYIKKEEISDYAEKNKIPYRVDRTNFKTDILRNKIRHNIIPELKNINPSLEKSMLVESLLLQIDDDYLIKESGRFSQLFLTEKIKLSDIKGIHRALLYRLLIEWIYRITGSYPSYKKVLDILDILDKEGEKKLNLGKGYILIKSYDYLLIETQKKRSEIFYKMKAGEEILIKEAGIILKSYITDRIDAGKLKDERRVVCFDIGEENPEFTVRSRKEGDKFLPFGRKTEKKLKDIFIELKIPRYMRDTIPLLEFRNKILWVIGYKRSGYYPITEKTEKMICFEIKEV
ncbi:tRNA(Ile)-lysidine synthase [Persephonella hydrogeniphila]|uniref:tRNA(Ile)-lysidine synthase n=1 Tax=Persephonella hydrogeniphila TaxID=198703 RepID=A0A285NEB9_9AQUI|nr:tRNA lysidine(34) synthetase TilS [Persephonella hydrogeniphila]SNZ07790.1 tRNA(Ile)-lysidine synthase [Persephonella hydrogeniphila]